MTSSARYQATIKTFLERWLPASAAQSAAIRLGGGTAVAQALAVLTAPILTRLYAPAEMGQFGLLVSFVGFASVGLCLRYDMAIVPAASDEESTRLLILALAISIPMSIVAAIILYALIVRQSLSYGVVPISSVPVTILLLAATGTFSAVRYWAIRREAFGTVGRAAVAQGTGRALLPLAAGAIGAGWWGLIMGEIAGRVFGIRPLMRLAIARIREVARVSTMASYTRSAKANWRYPAIAAPSAILDALGAALVLPIVAVTFGAAAAGQLLMVQRLASIPSSLIGSSVADVFHARISTLFRDDPAAMRSAVLRTVGKLLLIACALYIPLALVSIWGFGLIFGARWKEAGTLVALFTPLSITTLAVSPVTRLYFVVNRPELKLLFDVGFIAVPVLAFTVMHRHGHGYWACMAAYVALATIAYLLHLVLTLWAAGLPPRSREADDASAI